MYLPAWQMNKITSLAKDTFTTHHLGSFWGLKNSARNGCEDQIYASSYNKSQYKKHILRNEPIDKQPSPETWLLTSTYT